MCLRRNEFGKIIEIDKFLKFNLGYQFNFKKKMFSCPVTEFYLVKLPNTNYSGHLILRTKINFNLYKTYNFKLWNIIYFLFGNPLSINVLEIMYFLKY